MTGHSLSALELLPVTVTIKIRIQTCDNWAIVCGNITQDFIIGIDFLQQHGLDANTAQLDTVPLLIDASMSEPWRFAVQETVVIPEFREMVIPATLPSQAEGRSVTSCGSD